MFYTRKSVYSRVIVTYYHAVPLMIIGLKYLFFRLKVYSVDNESMDIKLFIFYRFSTKFGFHVQGR